MTAAERHCGCPLADLPAPRCVSGRPAPSTDLLRQHDDDPLGAADVPDGRTAYSFTMFQVPDMPDALFDAQHASLQREFANIEAIFAR
jgi:hypothetical protein